MQEPATLTRSQSVDETGTSALIAALQIRAEHHADVISRLIEMIARLDVRLEMLESGAPHEPSD
jgi:hypothetical protein